MTKTKSIYTKENLVKLDEKLKIVPIVFDPCFKGVFISNEEAFKRLVISSLHLSDLTENTKLTFIPNELLKENHKEYQKTLDIYATIDDNLHISVEINTKSFSDVKLRNFLYQTKLYSTLLESGQKPDKLNNVYLFQLNLNAKGKNHGIKENIIVPYDLTANKVYHENFVTVLKYLEVYRKLYYNGNRDEETVWLAALTAESFTELYDILDNVLDDKERDKFIRDVIRMSKDKFVLHEWEKEKAAALVESETIRNATEDGEAKGKAIGRAEGKAIGRAEGKAIGRAEGEAKGKAESKLEIAKNLLKKKIDIKTISEVVGLSVEELENLK